MWIKRFYPVDFAEFIFGCVDIECVNAEIIFLLHRNGNGNGLGGSYFFLGTWLFSNTYKSRPCLLGQLKFHQQWTPIIVLVFHFVLLVAISTELSQMLSLFR